MNNNLPMNFPMPMNMMNRPIGQDMRESSNLNSRQERTLYVGNLNPLMDEISLYAQFSNFGKIESIKVKKDFRTKQNKSYAFVVFEKLDNAKIAQKQMNNQEFFQRELRVYFKKNIRNFIKNDSNLIIKNIHSDISQRQLEEECQKFGNVISSFIKKVEKNGELVSLGYGYVQFEKKEDAENFMHQMNNKELNGQKIEVNKFVPPSQRHSEEKSSNLYVKNFPENFTQEQVEKFLKDNFLQFGNILSQGVFQDKNKNKFYAFVAFEESESAQKAIKEMNNFKVNAESDEEPLFVGIAQTKNARKKILSQNTSTQKKSLYVRSLKEDVTEDQLKQIFGVYGDIESVALREWKVPDSKLLPGQSSKKLQFGFVNFKNSKDAINMYCKYKQDFNLRQLVDVANDQQEYVFIPISKEARQKYLKTSMQQKKLRQKMLIQPPVNNMFMNNMPMHPPGMNMPPPPPQMFPPHNNQMIQNLQPPQMTQQISNKSPLEQYRDQLTNMSPTSVSKFIQNSLNQFQEFTEEEQKQILGEYMFSRIEQFARDIEGMSGPEITEMVPKITGMLIDQDVLELDEILEILDSDDTLEERFKEAIEVLHDDEESN